MPETTEIAGQFAERSEGMGLERRTDTSGRTLKLTIRWLAVLFCIAAWGGALYVILN
jgi:hypothetical protein